MQKLCTLIVIFLLLFIASLSGCNQTSTEREKFIGTWKTELKINPIGEGNYTETETFYANGSFVTTNMGLGQIPGKWQLSGGKLIIDIYFPGAYRYTFSQNDTMLTLVSESTGFTENLTKQ